MPHLNRAVNDPLIASIDYKAYSYQSAVVGEKDPEKTLDLSKLRFSLDDFQKLSKGTYNAGEFRITDSGKLDIVNNHKTWTIFNHKSVDGTDAYAIRVAFAKAMAAGGLDKNAMKTVRKALGLGPGYTLSSGTAMTPLTRQQVRELIDANITALNARRAPNNQLRTYDQLHAGYSVEEKRDIAAVREEINRTGGAPRILLNAELSDAMAVTKKNPSFEGLSEADAEDYLEFIDELSTALERLQDQEAHYDWIRENHTEHKETVIGGAIGMAIALEDGHVVFETVNDGKRSRINFGLTPEQLQARLDHAQELLNNITTLEVKVTGGDDLSDNVSQKAQPKKSNPSGNIPKKYDIEDNDDLDLSRSNIIQPKIILNTAPRKAPVIAERIEIKNEPPTESREAIAKRNLSTLAFLIAGHYHFDQDVATDILKQIEDWEEKLAECSTSGNPTDLTELNGDLREFLLNNRETIQPLIDQALADNRDE